MSQLVIQVQAGDSWLKVSTIDYERDHDDSGRKRRAAIAAGLLGLGDWRASDQFIGRKLRLAEEVVTGRWGKREFRAITGVRS